MPPKKALTCSQIVRLSQVALADTCQTWEVKCSAHALDLEIRAALARRMVGGDGICTGPCAASHGSPVKQVVPVEKEPENHFEEYAETVDQHEASQPDEPSVDGGAEPPQAASPPAQVEPQEMVTPPRLEEQPVFAWTPSEKPVRTIKKQPGNHTGKMYETAQTCKNCKEQKVLEWKRVKPPSSHGALCGWCRQRFVYHGRKHLGLKRAGTQDDFSKAQLEAIAGESKDLRAEWKSHDLEASDRAEATRKRFKKK